MKVGNDGAKRASSGRAFQRRGAQAGGLILLEVILQVPRSQVVLYFKDAIIRRDGSNATRAFGIAVAIWVLPHGLQIHKVSF